LEISSEFKAEFSNILVVLLDKQALYAPVSHKCLKKYLVTILSYS